MGLAVLEQLAFLAKKKPRASRGGKGKGEKGRFGNAREAILDFCFGPVNRAYWNSSYFSGTLEDLKRAGIW
jgi:hypothetical protein